MKLLDTTFLIDILQGGSEIVEFVALLDKSGPHATTTINVHEYLVGGFGSQSSDELQLRRKMLSKLVILDYNSQAAEISAQIEAVQRKNGHFIGTADIMIAAVMISNGLKEIITENIRHFEKIDQIKVVSYRD